MAQKQTSPWTNPGTTLFHTLLFLHLFMVRTTVGVGSLTRDHSSKWLSRDLNPGRLAHP